MSQIKLRPLHDLVVIEPNVADNKTKGGILIPDKAIELPNSGKVLAVGPGRHNPMTGVLMPMTLQPGMEVMYGQYNGQVIKQGDATYLVMKESEVQMVVEK